MTFPTIDMCITNDDVYEIAEAAGIDDDGVRTDYSGRAMFGATCLAFDVPNMSTAFRIIAAAAKVFDPDVAMDLASNARTDSMGLGIVVYFPGVQVDG